MTQDRLSPETRAALDAVWRRLQSRETTIDEDTATLTLALRAIMALDERITKLEQAQ